MSEFNLFAVVDDDESTRSSLEGLLRSLGHRAETFASAETYLSSAAAISCDCVISDVNMPGGMTGIELASIIRAERPGTPVILMTGMPTSECRQEALLSGACSLLSKPIAEATLLLSIDQALSDKS